MKVVLKKKYWCKCGNSTHPHKNIKNKDIHGKGNLYRYEVKNINFCCDKMREAFDERFIGFGDFEDAGYYGYNGANTDINIYNCSPYPEGACWDEIKINLCPFCGEVVEVKNGK